MGSFKPRAASGIPEEPGVQHALASYSSASCFHGGHPALAGRKFKGLGLPPGGPSPYALRMPEVPKLREPLGHDYSGVSVGGPSDKSWQTGYGQKKHAFWREKLAIKAMREGDLYVETNAMLSEFQRLMYRDA